jgi:hypothetical protein
MATTKKKIDLFNSIEGAKIREDLEAMMRDKSYKTDSSYTADGFSHPDHKMPFVQKHMNYLAKHSELNPEHYLSNLRLMLKKR